MVSRGQTPLTDITGELYRIYAVVFLFALKTN